MRDVLILIPGLLCDEAVWSSQIEGLSDAFDIRVADLRRCATIGAMAAKILCDAPPRFSVAGHSMGARVAIEMARHAADRITRLALLDTGIHPVREGEAARRAALVDLADRRGMAALAEAWVPPMVRKGLLEERPELRAALYAMVGRATPDMHRDQITALLDRPDARAALPAIACPTLVGVGRHDAWSPLSQHEEIARLIPTARLVVFEDAGHMAPMENAVAVTAALRRWMQEPTPAA